MRFLADENFPANAVKELKAAGHDVIWVRTAAPGSRDEDILALAAREERIILTFDKDFGELAARGCRYRLELYYFAYRCRQQRMLEPYFLPELANELIGVDTSQ
jgi:uncharacterized protein with PIN domain